jgi:hypothetical protein
MEEAMFTTQSKTTQNNSGQSNSTNSNAYEMIRKVRRCILHVIVITALGAFAFAQAPAQNPAHPAQNGSAQKNPTAPRTAGRGNAPTTHRSASSEPQRLPLRRVVLYKSGVGYFEHAGQVRDNEDLEIDLTSSQLNDVLKSLTALDLNGGRIVGASYSSQEPAGHQLESLPIPVANKTNLSDLLQALRGARIEVRSANSVFTGRVLGVEKVQRPSGPTGVTQVTVDRVNLIGESGELRQIMLDQGTSMRFVDRDMEKQLERAMGLLDASHQEDTRRLILSTAGVGERTVRVSYISEVPVWKMTYRIVLPERADRKPLLQGWAVVDNTVGEDWENVELSLASGAPQSFIQNLSQPLYTRRPMVGLPQAYQLTPQLHSSTLVPGPTRLVGGVVDPDGKAVAGASVRVLDSNGRVVAAGKSGSNGVYLFEGLPQGTFDLEVTAPNFKWTRLNSIRVTAGNTSRYDTKLEIGAVTMETTVQAGGQQVLETMNSSVQTTISGRTITTLPYTSHSGTLLSALDPGAQMAGGAGNSRFEGVQIDGVGITFDGINVADNSNKSTCGLFANLDARINDVEEFGINRNAMERSMNAGTGTLLGDMFEYRARDRVTIRKNQSALVPIAQAEIVAEKVALWNANLGISRPLRALWLKNTSDLVLDSGSFNVIEDNAFAGEGLMATLHPGERRLISYSADLAVQVVPRHEPVIPKVTRVQVANSQIIRTDEHGERTIYTIRNEDTHARIVVLEHPIRNDWKLSEDLKPEEKTSDVYRFRVEVAAKQTRDFSVEETHSEDQKIDLTTFDEDDFNSLAADNALTPELEKALKDLIVRSNAIDELGEQIKAKGDDENNLFKDQNRLRENMKTLKGTPEEKALLQRYTKELNDEEDKLAKLRSDIAELEAQKKKAQAELDKTIEKMSFDVKL